MPTLEKKINLTPDAAESLKINRLKVILGTEKPNDVVRFCLSEVYRANYGEAKQIGYQHND